MSKIISAKQLKEKIESREDFYLIDTLQKNSFDSRHIPTAKHVEYGMGFVKKFKTEIGAPKDAEIIVYCASSGCQLSVLAAEELKKEGYVNVVHFVDGLSGWIQEGYKFEGEAA